MVHQSQFIGQFGSIVADKKLSDIAEIYDGVHQTPHYTDSGVIFISVEDISDIYASKKYISIEDYSKYKHVPDLGDLIMTRIGTIGMCAVVSKSEPLAYYVSVTLIKPDHSVIDSTYLKYYIESDYGQSELRMRSLLEAFPMKINLNEIGKIAIKVPALDEQRAFVSIVKQADKSKFGGLKSQFIEMFSGREYPQLPIRDFADITTGSTPSKSHPEYWGGNNPWVSAEDMKDKYVFDTAEKVTNKGYATCKHIPVDTLMYVCRGSIGVMSINKVECATNQSICTATCNADKCEVEFLYHSLLYKKDEIKQIGIGTNFKSLNQTTFSNLRISLPPIEDQRRFVTITKQADKSKYLN